MKKIITLFLFLVLFVSSVNSVSAKILTNKQGSVDIEKNEVVNDDLLIYAKNITLDGTVNGDVFIGGETATINGVVNGNLHVGSRTVFLKGKVKGNVYIGSQNITVTESTIGGSLLMGAANASVDKDTTINGSVFVGAGNVIVDSLIKRSLYLGAGSATVQDNTKIGMDLYYAYNETDNKINISDKSVISGNTYKKTYQTPDKPDTQKFRNSIKPIKSAIGFISFISALVIGLIYFKLFGRHLAESASIVSQNFWKSLGIGFLVIITIIPTTLILLITIIGIPLIGISFLLITLFSYLSKFVVGLALGNLIVNKFKWKKITNYWILTLGLVVIYLLKAVPGFDAIISFIITLTGLGALTLQLFNKNK